MLLSGRDSIGAAARPQSYSRFVLVPRSRIWKGEIEYDLIDTLPPSRTVGTTIPTSAKPAAPKGRHKLAAPSQFGITVAFVFLKIWLAKAASKNSLCSSPVL